MKSLLAMSLMLSSCLLVGCGSFRPPAPEELEELAAYLFANVNEDEGALAEGAENLYAYLLEDLEAVEAGYSVWTLTEESVDALDCQDRRADSLRGVTVATLSPHPPEDIAMVLTLGDFAVISSSVLKRYERTYMRNANEDRPDCFYRQECAFVEANNRTVTKSFSIEARNWIQYRWVDTALGPVLFHRTWLLSPSRGSLLGISFGANSNYHVGVTMPHKGGSLRLHTTWFDMKLPNTPGLDEVWWQGEVLSTLRNDSKKHDEWLTEHRDQLLGPYVCNPDSCGSDCGVMDCTAYEESYECNGDCEPSELCDITLPIFGDEGCEPHQLCEEHE